MRSRVLLPLALLLVFTPHLSGVTSDAELIQRIVNDYPAIVGADDWTKVRILREFSYRHTAYATAVDTDGYAAGEQNVTDVFSGNTTLGDGYVLFDNALGGVVCGGTSQMLMKLYQLFGYSASTLSIGWSAQDPTPLGSTFSHVQDLVAISHNGRSYRTVSDAIVNITYTTPTGGPLDYHDMVWLLAQNLSSRVSTSGPIDGGPTNPSTVAMGFLSDEPDPGIGLASFAVDPTNYSLTILSDRWRYDSPRTAARLDALGAQTGSWFDQLQNEGRPRETVYLHTFPYDPANTAGPVIATAKRILADFRSLRFNYREGYANVSSNPDINAISAAYNAEFTLNNDSCTNGCGVGLYPVPTTTNPDSANLYFNPRSGSVSGQILFPVPVASVDLDVTYFNGGNVTMTAYDPSGVTVGSAQGADVAGLNHLGITAPSGNLIKKVILNGSNGSAAINIKNLQARALGPTTRFSYHEGFVTGGNPGINNVAATHNAQFTLANDSCTNGCGIGLYPVPTASAPNGSSLYFNPRNGAVNGQITFTTPVSAVAMDITYFAGGTVTLSAYDQSWTLIGQVVGADQAGQNHLALTANPGNTKPIKYVRLTGSQSNAALNIKNLMQFSWD